MRGALTPSAAQFCDAVAADPTAAVTVAVTGPDRYGREHVAARLRQAWVASGVAVLDADDVARPATDPVALPDPASVAVVVEDAHLLDPAALGALRAWVGAPGARCVVTYRPWPRSTALADVVRSLRRRPVVLGALDRPVLAAHLRSELGDLPAREREALLDVLDRAVGGVPAWVEALVGTWAADPAERTAAAATGEVSPRIAERLAQELALVDDDVADLLLALAVGGAPTDADTDVVASAAASGLLLADGALVPFVRLVLLRATPPPRLREAQRALLQSAGTDPRTALALARALAGERHRASADALLLAADRALADDPALAGALYEQARACGAPPLPSISRQAEACALAGDSERALLLADEVLARAGAAGGDDLARCVVVAATVLAHRSLLTGSAELYRWSSDARTGAAAPFAVLAFVGVGMRAEAEAARALAVAGAPTLLAGAAALMADGVLASLDDGSAPAALAALTSAAAMLETSARSAVLPDTPAALAALVALHSGDLDAARGVLTRAIAGGQGGRSAQPRHHLLLAWTAMVAGGLREASAHVDAAPRALGTGGTAATGTLEPRDALMLEALRVGLARRDGDVAALTLAWARARQQLLAQPVDLYALLPLGELAVGAARLGEDARMRPHLEAARALLDRLGRPALWSTSLHWAQLQAAVLSEDTGAAQHAAAALAAAAASDRSGGAGAFADAGAAWVGVLAGEIDADAVEAAARGLVLVGRTWDACRLAGQAAVRTPDRRAMTSLLHLARTWVSEPGEAAGQPAGRGEPDDAPSDPGAGPRHEPPVVLSAREREVAALVVTGKTYREVGAELFLSPKTVEHHVARLRQRLGAEGRAELFTGLRTLLADPR